MDISIFIVLLLHFCCLALLTFHFGICFSEIVCIPSEREALLRFKHHLQDPSNKLSSWNASNSNCCHWAGVVCSDVTSHVLQLHLRTSPPTYGDYATYAEQNKAYEEYLSQRFGGEINTSLVELKHLTHLDLSGNDFGGTQIPTFLGEMTSLTYLNLSHAGFYGTIPHLIGNLSNLLFLDLSYSAIGAIPYQIGNLTNLLCLRLPSYSDGSNTLFAENIDWLSGLSHLQYLDLGNANLSKSFDLLQTLQALPSLVELRLIRCTFPIHYNKPSSLNFSSLTTLDFSFSYNVNSSVVLKWIFGLRKLVSLQLYQNGIQGPIPDGIQNLTLLENLGLSYNSLSSSIPDWLYRLRHLKFLNLKENNLRGNIFDALGNLTSLVKLDLSFNQLEGRIPTSLEDLTSLAKLDLSDNQLEGKIPTSLGNLCNLREIGFSYVKLNQQVNEILEILTPCVSHGLTTLTIQSSLLSGNLTDQIGLFKNLVRLDFSDNSIHGALPSSFGKLSSLRYLDLSENQLNGALPSSFGKLSSLTYLRLSENQLNGALRSSFGKLSSLGYLDLSENQLNGALPSSFGKLSSLRYLHLSENQLNGALPSSFGKLSSLRSLFLYKNQFNGNPFEVLRSLSELSFLSIGNNLFQGAVKEDDLANLKSLEVLHALGNNLTLEVGPSWHPSFQLRELSMSSWQLGPNFPSWIQSQKDIEYLDMSNTGISDSIPPWFWETFSHVNTLELDLSHNHIHGELTDTSKNPISLFSIDLSSNKLCGKLPYLSGNVGWLDLSSNLFSGTMTDFLCRNQGMPMQLGIMNLASNNLSGEIPDCWRRWTNLVEVNLQSNNFVGNLPPSMGSIASLESLHIGNNALVGTFPHILKNNSELISLDLEENKLTGIIPAWVGQRLSNLKILCLRSNKFLGHIPNEICGLSFLQVLDLAQNDLSGNIPSCFNQLSAMTQKNKSADPLIYVGRNYSSPISMLLLLKGREDEYTNILGLVTSIDLSENKLSGEIPKEITSLHGLNFLNLSQNQLSGHIPSSIGNMGSLQSIDFSRNELSGQIPQTISNLNFLSMLDFSYNHLKGEIPTGTQLQSFEASNFVGNNLCGPPLPVNCSSHEQVPNDDHNVKESDRHGVNWFFVSMAFGFVVGFWAVVAPLFIFRSWRHTYYRFLDDMWYKVQSCW